MMEEYLAWQVERFSGMIKGIIQEINKETQGLKKGQKDRETTRIIHNYLRRFIKDITLVEPVLSGVKWRFSGDLKGLSFKENVESFGRPGEC